VHISVDDFTVPVISPVGLVLLKLIAWKERHPVQPKKDAADIAYVLRHYSTLLTEKALFDDYFDIVEASGFAVDLAAGRVLGGKISKLAAPDTRGYVEQLLNDELSQDTDSRLVREVAETLAGAEEERAFQLLSSLKMGFDEGAAK
jgi:predicted nucleotidyltransferase